MSQTSNNEVKESTNIDLSNIIFRSPESKDKYFQVHSDEKDFGKFYENYTKAISKFIETACKNDEKILKEIEEYKLTLLKEVEEERNKIRVLIILGSKVETNEEDLIINNEFFTISLFLRHLFKYVYSIPEQNILLTTSNHKNISQQYSDLSCKISPPTSPIKDPNPNLNQTISEEDQNKSKEEAPEIIYTEEQLKELLRLPLFHDNVDLSVCGIHFAQVADHEYRFYIKDYRRIIKPFNRYFLKALNVNQDSTLFVFILDQCIHFDYQFFIERLNELNTKKYIIFNECCQSGSLIELIHISEKLLSIFPFLTQYEIKDIFKEFLQIAKYIQDSNAPIENDNQNPNESVDIQTILKQIEENKYYPEENSINRESKQTLSVDLKVEINDKIKTTLTKYEKSFQTNHTSTLNIISSYINDIVEIIIKLSTFSKLYQIDPYQFIRMKQKSTIICSAPYYQSSMPLPLQFFHCQPTEYYQKIRSNGTFFTSAYIKYLLNPCDNLKPINIANQIQRNFKELKELFQNVLIEQVKFEKDDINRVRVDKDQLFIIIQRSLEDYIEAINYFHTNYTSQMTFITGDDFTFPNMNKLIVPKEFWNFQRVELPNDIYKRYKFIYYYSSSSIIKHVLKHSTKDTEYHKYGPVEVGFYKFQFEVDFIDCLKANLSKYGMLSRFDLGLMSANEVYTKETLEKFTVFRMGNLRPYMDENNGNGIMALYSIILHNLNSNFSDSEENRRTFLYCCESAISTITKAWKGIFIY